MTHWTVGGESEEVKVSGKQVQLPHFPPFKLNPDASKEMQMTIERWNQMQKCLIDNNLMKSK